jgi:hypothetical protein
MVVNKFGSIAAPIVKNITICICFVLLAMMTWYTLVNFYAIYMDVPQGFEHYDTEKYVLLLLKTIYGPRQSAK